jgi:hypothetical protein
MENTKLEELGQKPTRRCTVCNLKSHNLELFVKDKGSKHGRRNLCISCCVERNEAHPKTKDWKTDHQVKKRYGINRETYLERMASSDCCEICSSKNNLCYDHDHATMQFRGVLCRSCNKAIGQLGDNLESLQKAVDYLKKGRVWT